MNLKKTISVFLCLCMVLSAFAVVPFSAFAAEADIVETGASVELAETSAGIYGLADNVQDGQILQCWNWSYRNIAKNMSKIAQQGFSAIQTSPIQATKETTKEYYNTVMNSSWVVYQPVAFNIETNDFNALGTKADFEYMCEVAHKYGVKVIVDAVLNHMANNMSGNTIHTWVPSELKDNSDCWHDISKDIYNYDNRYDVTHYCITGLPDLNTANSTVQKHCKNFLKEAIAAGADGFRFDAAKHIETDWDADGTKSDFWKNVLASATNYAQENRGITPYYYGEMLGSPGGGLSIEAYTQYMSVTDPGNSDNIRNGVCNGNASAAASGSVSYGASKDKIVQWTESHDNHKDHGTNNISEANINKTWAIIGAKDDICGMYLARPKDMSTTMMGDADYTSWSYPEVKAVNDFKNYFIGQGEYLSSYNKLACVERGSTGIVIVNTGGTYYDDINVPVHTMKSGTYTDAITGNTFTVSGGYIKGDIGDTGIAVVYDVENRGVFTEGNVTEVSVAGSFNNWDTSADRMIAIDGNTVSTTMFLSKGTYKFKISTTTGMWYGNGGTIEDSTGSSGWTMKSSDDDNCTLNASGGKYTFKFNVSTGKLVVEYENTTDRASGFYLKGTMNEWGSSAPFVYADDSNTVTATVSLSAGTYNFKINNEAENIWYSNAGTINDTTGDTGWTMKVGLSDKCTLVATGGNYTFSFNLSTQKLTVTTDAEVTTTTSVETDPSESSEVDTGTGFFLKGTFNDWNDSNPFVETAEADVVTTAIKLEAGTYTFKIHDSNTEKWRSNTGTINDKTNSSGWTMSSSVDDKCTLNASGGLYTFNFNTSTYKLVVLYTPDETDPTETTVATHKVTFKDYDGTVLSEQEVKDGESAKAPASPERAADAQYTYTFTGWDKDFTNVTEDITVTAIYSKTVNKYTVTFVDFDGTELYKVQVEYGSAATIPPVEPEREGYVFTGWDKAFDNITEDITVTAQYMDATVYLKGSFNDWGNTNPMLLSTDDSNVYTTTLELSEGTYTFKINYKESWYGNNGTFTDTTVTSSSGGWKMETGKENCTLKASGGTYTFKYDISTQKLIVLYTAPEYTVTFVDFDGSVIDTQTVKRGDSATAPATPTREGDAQYAYAFKEWDTDFTSIKADTIVTAIYTQTLNKYTVTFVDYDGTKLGAQQVEYGKSATAPDTPVREGYTFKGWDKAFDNVTENITVTATYTSNAKKTYSVFYVNADGTYLGFEQVEEGKAAVGIEAPTMAADAQYTYTFAGWDADLDAITADTIATAKYDTTVNKYTVTFTDKDGGVLDTQKVAYGAAATAPEAPVVDGYTFTGWDTAFDNVTSDITVKAQYSKVVAPATTGKLQIEVTGGAGFTIAVNDGAARPQGTSYTNTKMAMGASVTLVANTSGNEFLGWVDAVGNVVSAEETYTFVTSGNDYLKAMYKTEVANVNLVVFKNDKANAGLGQVLEMQYYAAGDEIVFPENATQAGYTFVKWSMTAEEIQAELAAGRDVEVTPVFERAKVYVAVVVNNGTVTGYGGTQGGKYLAYTATTVQAATAPAGQKFAYWVDKNGKIKSYDATYKFFPSNDVELTAVYVGETETVEKELIVGITADATVEGNNITFIMNWYVPEEVGTFVQGGVMVVESSKYNPETFIYGGNKNDSNITQAYPAKTYQKASQPGTSLTKQNVCYSGDTWYGVTWVRYTDAVTGEEKIAYSDMIAVTKP